MFDFGFILAINNFFSCASTLLELAAAVKLRYKFTGVKHTLISTPGPDRYQACSTNWLYGPSLVTPAIAGVCVLIAAFFNSASSSIANLVALLLGVIYCYIKQIQ